MGKKEIMNKVVLGEQQEREKVERKEYVLRCLRQNICPDCGGGILFREHPCIWEYIDLEWKCDSCGFICDKSSSGVYFKEYHIEKNCFELWVQNKFSKIKKHILGLRK